MYCLTDSGFWLLTCCVLLSCSRESEHQRMCQPHAGLRQLEVRHHDAGQRSAAAWPQHCAARLRKVRTHFYTIIWLSWYSSQWRRSTCSQDPAAVRRSGRSLQGVQRPEGASGWADHQVWWSRVLRGRHAVGKETCAPPRWTPTPGVAASRDGGRSRWCKRSRSREEDQGGGPEGQETCRVTGLMKLWDLHSIIILSGVE